MSCGTVVPKDSMKKTENSKYEAQNNENNQLVSFFNHKTGEMSIRNMSQTIDLFRKYLLIKSQNTMSKTNEEESEAIKRSPPCCLVPPKVGSNLPRHPSFLEQRILAELRADAAPPTLSNYKSSKAQLTIFYSGAIQVYDNVPIDKAQAIMLLAGKSSLPNSEAKINPKAPLPCVSLPSVCNLQAGLPIARKHSLQRFLEKRRERTINKSPYASTPTRKRE